MRRIVKYRATPPLRRFSWCEDFFVPRDHKILIFFKRNFSLRIGKAFGLRDTNHAEIDFKQCKQIFKGIKMFREREAMFK